MRPVAIALLAVYAIWLLAQVGNFDATALATNTCNWSMGAE